MNAKSAGDNQMTWEEFCYQHIETGFFDHDDREKTVLAMRRLVERVPSEVLESLDVLFFAPSQHIYGQVFPAGGHIGASLLYLSPDLEGLPQEEVDFTVAHEVAHAFLGHDNYVKNGPEIENQADALAVEWGFILPERRKK